MIADPRYDMVDTVSTGESWMDAAPHVCEVCGEDDIERSAEAYDLTGECVCETCAVSIIEDHGQFGVGA